jgi:hypothetical protein
MQTGQLNHTNIVMIYATRHLEINSYNQSPTSSFTITFKIGNTTQRGRVISPKGPDYYY